MRCSSVEKFKLWHIIVNFFPHTKLYEEGIVAYTADVSIIIALVAWPTKQERNHQNNYYYYKLLRTVTEQILITKKSYINGVWFD